MTVGGVGVEGDVCKNRKLRQFFFEGTDRPINQPLGIKGLLGAGGAQSLRNDWEDGDPPDTASGETVCLANESRNGKTEMTGKAGDGLRSVLAVDNKKRGDEMRGGNIGFGENPPNSRSPTETTGTDGNV